MYKIGGEHLFLRNRDVETKAVDPHEGPRCLAEKKLSFFLPA